ncbi:TPA: LCP family protein [Streptococcus agalactiae]
MKIWKKITLMFSAIILTTVIALGVYVASAYNFSTNELSKTFKDFKLAKSKSHAIEETEPFSILLMGVDTGSEHRKSKWSGNSDSMILVTINPKTNKTTMTSLERDVLIKLSGPKNNGQTGVEAKLNAAYASGGAEMALMTVQDLLDINVDYFMQINMQGLVDLVNAVGGITVTNKFDFPISIAANEPEYKAVVEPGTHKINGEQALVYSRMRYDDPEGDYGRQKRQREVIQKVLKKILALNSISSYKKILSAVSNNMQTNIEISSKTIPNLLAYKDSLEHIKSYQLKGEDATLSDGGSYQILTKKHLLAVQNRIKKELDKKRSKTLKTSAILYEDYYGTTASNDSSTYSSTQENNYNTTPYSEAPPSYSGNTTYSSETNQTTHQSYYNSSTPANNYSSNTNTGQADSSGSVNNHNGAATPNPNTGTQPVPGQTNP